MNLSLNQLFVAVVISEWSKFIKLASFGSNFAIPYATALFQIA
jgi:hypothetical protein